MLLTFARRGGGVCSTDLLTSCTPAQMMRILFCALLVASFLAVRFLTSFHYTPCTANLHALLITQHFLFSTFIARCLFAQVGAELEETLHESILQVARRVTGAPRGAVSTQTLALRAAPSPRDRPPPRRAVPTGRGPGALVVVTFSNEAWQVRRATLQLPPAFFPRRINSSRGRVPARCRRAVVGAASAPATQQPQQLGHVQGAWVWQQQLLRAAAQLRPHVHIRNFVRGCVVPLPSMCRSSRLHVRGAHSAQRPPRRRTFW